ncbi:unnamed protein product [Diatraea saccharalis]|uniref:Uncharacterized protein n=1 Tax=Diatraea saccharalis TaxID=40085 RepID=A0A9N9QXN3_9NEOP|nr:unnamed protein product [Diatraea saccharalis]
MSELESTGGEKNDNRLRKRIRHRKKNLYEKILKQMEFYFSDANLSKDRFLGELIKNDPYVPIETFLKFNQIRAMTSDVFIIAKAMKNSTMLELSEDKLKIKRKSPVLPYDADVRTVYVESIPVTASREWLEKVFSEFGRVAYISLPKFKISKIIKGYAFIEFSQPDEAQKCIATFTKMGCKLPTCMQPENLSSIKMFSAEDTVNDNAPKKEETEDLEPPKKKTKKHKEKKTSKSLELKLESESDCEKKIDTPTEENKEIVSTPTEENKMFADSKDEMTTQDEDQSDEDTKKKRKLRKKLAKDKAKAKNGLNKNEAPPGALWGLQVLPKSEWKALRNKYLNLQRKYMKEIKTALHNKRHAYSSIPAPAAPSVEVEPGINPTQTEGNKIPLEKIPGVFVKEILPEPCLDVRQAKRTVKTNIHVQHVDVKEGQSELIIRFDSAKAAEEYCASAGARAHVMHGDDEEHQWSRAEAARSVRRPRGRDRLLARTAAARDPLPPAPAPPQPTHTHIRFDDE